MAEMRVPTIADALAAEGVAGLPMPRDVELIVDMAIGCGIEAMAHTAAERIGS